MEFDDSYGPAFTALSMPYISPPLNQPEAQPTTMFGGTIPAIQTASIPPVQFGVPPAVHFGTPPAITSGTPPAMGFGTAGALGFGTPSAINCVATTQATRTTAAPTKTVAARPSESHPSTVSAISRIGSTSVNYVHTPSPSVRNGTQQPIRTNSTRTSSTNNVSNRHVESTQSIRNNEINRGSTSSPVRTTTTNSTSRSNTLNMTANYDSHIDIHG
jgi:hypothetical protein